MQVVYIYDLKAKNKKKFNRLKRVFYYHLNKLPLKKEHWKTKSTLSVKTTQEKQLDLFFRRFRKEVIVYKLYTDFIERLD
ncbi:MAG: hypothetical protein ABH842_03400 [Candidatus Micrarchaeota archaeon]